MRIKRSEIRMLSDGDRARVQLFAVELLNDFVTGARATNSRGESYLCMSGPAVFVERMMLFLIRERITTIGNDPSLRGTLHDIRSIQRLNLIWATNVKRWWKEKNRDPSKPLKYL
jgi:hypothetical protein